MQQLKVMNCKNKRSLLFIVVFFLFVLVFSMKLCVVEVPFSLSKAIKTTFTCSNSSAARQIWLSEVS